jgi:hypothetical protein
MGGYRECIDVAYSYQRMSSFNRRSGSRHGCSQSEKVGLRLASHVSGFEVLAYMTVSGVTTHKRAAILNNTSHINYTFS